MKLKQGSSFWIHSVFFTLLNRSFLIAFGVVSYIILVKKVFPTAKEMGIWALFLTIFTLIENIKQGLLRNPMIKYLSEPEYVNHRNKVQSSSLITNILFSGLVIALLFFGGNIFAGWLNAPELYPLFRLGILVILILIPFQSPGGSAAGTFQIQSHFLWLFVQTGTFYDLVNRFSVYDKPFLTLINLVKLQIISQLLGTIVLLYFARGYLYRSFETDKRTMLRMFNFGKYIFGTNVFASLGRSADQFISAGLISANVVAYYNIVARINNMMDVPSFAIADVLFPKNVEAMVTSGPDKVRYYFERMVGTIVSILAPLSILIFLLTSFFHNDTGRK